MEQQHSEDKTDTRSIQDYLSLGYVFLLILGIASDSIFYSFFGINIISYSNVLDVLLSPVVYLTKNVVFPTIIIVLPFIAYIFFYLGKKNHARKKQNGLYKTEKSLIAAENLFSKKNSRNVFLGFSAWIIFSAYIGFAVGSGSKYLIL